MNQFIRDYIDKLQRVSSDEGLTELYHWFWDNQESIKRTAEDINRELRLDGDYALKPDLPCLSMGARRGLLFLLVNPGWSAELNRQEDEYCRKSKDHYTDLVFNFFTRHPQVVGKRIGFTAQMISLVGVLRDGAARFGHSRTPDVKWQRAQDSGLLGHWELFPFHSAKDGVTRYVNRLPWVSLCIKESALATLRFEPECLLAMSKEGWNLLRNELFPQADWQDDVVGSPATRLSYCVVPGQRRNTEIVAIARQVLSSHRICTNRELFEAVNRLRQRGVTPL